MHAPVIMPKRSVVHTVWQFISFSLPNIQKESRKMHVFIYIYLGDIFGMQFKSSSNVA